MKIVTVIGARPQFIKAAVVSRAIAQYNKTARATQKPLLEEIIVHTGQHYDQNMSEVFFRELEIPAPHYHLGIGSGSHGAQTGRMLEAVENVLLKERPDLVLVCGDTNSTLAGALAAVKLHIPVAHVEAGLRSFNRQMPEEINRVLTDHIADILFAPTEAAVENLRREGIPEERVHLVGDVMYDAALYYGKLAGQKSRILENLGLQAGGYILATVHRAENTDSPQRLKAIFQGLELAVWQAGLPVVLPLHPRTKMAMQQYGMDKQNLVIIPPLGYLDMVMLEQNAALIATDSGGVQKEAYFFRVPCVTLREETEWVELVQTGWNRLVPPVSAEAVTAAVRAALGNRGREVQLYGDGRAGETVVGILT